MATLGEQVEADVLGVYLNASEFAEEISYTASGSEAVTITAIVSAEDEVLESDESGRVVRREVTVVISTDSVQGIASPGLDDAFVVDGLTYEVRAVGRKVLGLCRLTGVYVAPELRAPEGSYREQP